MCAAIGLRYALRVDTITTRTGTSSKRIRRFRSVDRAVGNRPQLIGGANLCANDATLDAVIKDAIRVRGLTA
jgi:hypothetical protein